jgi:DGQHR domain-containing protein
LSPQSDSEELERKISATTNQEEKEVNLLLHRLGLRLVDCYAKFEDPSVTVGEIDGLFEFEGNVLVVETRKKKSVTSNEILGFFAKWSDEANLDLLRRTYNLQRESFHRVFFDRSRERPEELGALEQVCRDPRNHIVFEDEYTILQENVRLVGSWERNNFLAKLGIQRKRFQTTEIDAVLFYLGDKPAYLFSLNAKELLDCCHITRRYKYDPGYQRAINPARIAKMRKGIRAGRILAFPNSIIINSKKKLMEQRPSKEDCPRPTVVKIHLPADYSFCKVIDGQHRLLAFTQLDQRTQETHDLPVVAFEELTPHEEANMFIVINTTQKKVDPNLVLILKADSTQFPQDKFWYDKIAVEVAKELDRNSFLKNRIYMGFAGEKRTDKWVPLQTLVTAMKAHRFVGRYSLFQQSPTDVQSPTGKIREVFSLLSQNQLVTSRNRFFLEARGIRILFRLVHLFEKNAENNNIDISFDILVARLSNIMSPSLRKKLIEYYGVGGANRAVVEIVHRLKQRFPTQFRRFETDLRSL